jgi:hypothetical protein
MTAFARRHGPIVALVGGAFAYAVFLMAISRHFSFAQDELKFFTARWQWNTDSLLSSYEGHWILFPAIFYKLLFATVGLRHTWPYRLVLVSAHVTCVVLTYLLAARRTDRWTALVPAALLLVLGSASEDLLFAFTLNFVGALAAGLGALLALGKDSRTGDRWAAFLLFVSVSTGGPGLAMVAAAGGQLLADGSLRRRGWTVLTPLVIFFLWSLTYGTAQGSSGNILLVPEYGAEMAAAGIAGMLGVGLVLGRVLLVGCVLWIALGVFNSRLNVRNALPGLLGAVALWTIVALARAQQGVPTTSRYIYPSAVFILLSAIGFIRPFKPSSRAAIAAAFIVVWALVANLNPLLEFAQLRTKGDPRVMIALGAAQIAGPAGNPDYRPDRSIHDVTLGPYLTAVRHLGSPAYSEATIVRLAHERVRPHLADRTILAAEGISPSAAPEFGVLPASQSPVVTHVVGTTFTTTTSGAARCARLGATDPDASADLAIRTGATLYLNLPAGGSASIRIRRLSPTYPKQPTFTLSSSATPAKLSFPVDLSNAPWEVQVALAPVTIACVV